MILYTLYFILGLVVGSFLNVVIDRLEAGESIIKSRSYCPKCRTVLKWNDLIPVLSFIFLKGKCRYCGQKISWQYPIVEIATASLFLLIFNFQFSISNFIEFIYLLFITSCLIVIFVSDLKYLIIPDKIIYPAIGITFVYRLFENWNLKISNLLEIENWSPTLQSFGDGAKLIIFKPFWMYLLSALVALVFFLAIVVATKGRGMGLGDAKLAFLMGLILGWPEILLALFLAFLSGALIGLGLIAAGYKTLKSQIPFGPFLSASTILVLFLASQIFTP